MKTMTALVLAALGCAGASTSYAVTIEFVTVGNPGNAPYTFAGEEYGSVAYPYRMGKYEVTAGQYTEFLNAVAKDDPHGLYNAQMLDGDSQFSGANIQRTGSSSSYVYSVAADWANRPVNFVSFWDAARFANWLHNGQPIGPQGPATTEGGAYHDVGDQSLFGRNAGAKFVIPTEDEWLKAALHKNDGVTGNYWMFPTSSDEDPRNTLPDTGNNANYWYWDHNSHTDYFTIGPPYYRTEVGEFENSPSPYGTFDQGGNVLEWNETAFGSYRGARGGSFGSELLNMHNYYFFDGGPPELETTVRGFRVAGIPEPSAGLLGALAAAGLAPLSKRRSKPISDCSS